MRLTRTHVVTALLLACGLHLAAQKAAVTPKKPIPSEYILEPWVIGSEVPDQWKGLLPTVNGPTYRRRAFPGQHLTIAIGAQGQDREQLLKGGSYDISIEFGGSTKTFKALRPIQTRRIKAEGADFVKFLTKEAKVEAGGIDSVISLVSLALLDLDWVVPADARDGSAKVTGSITTPSGKVTPLKNATVDVWSFDRAAKDGGFKDRKDAGEWVMTYYQHPEPSRLLHALNLDKDNPASSQLNVIAFYVEVLKASPLASQDLLQRLRTEDRVVRGRALLLMSEAGYELTSYLQTLPEEDRTQFSKTRETTPALPDPYDLTLDPVDPYRITTRMDMLWSRFLATGDPKPVRAIAQVLQWRDDWEVFTRMKEEFQKTGKRTSTLSPELIRAMAYGASGWSLGSFVRNHPLVADFVDAWKQDPTVPKIIKEELDTLLTNQAFKRQ